MNPSLPIRPAPAVIGGGRDTHVALIEPLIPPNTGNVARVCAATGAWLHLVEPLGFDLDHSKVKRAGLDYWPNVRLSLHPDIDSFIERLDTSVAFFFSKNAARRYTDVTYPEGPVLVFGQETTGLSDELLDRYSERSVRIPISADVRSLNLSNAAAIAVYEVIRQRG